MISHREFSSRAFSAILIFFVFAALLALLWLAKEIVLLAFAGFLLSILFRNLAELLSRTGLPRAVSLAIVIIVLVGGIVSFFWLAAPGIAEQIVQLRERIPQALARLRETIGAYSWGQSLLDQMPTLPELIQKFSTGGLLSRITGVVGATLNIITNIFIILWVGVYLSVSPELYRRLFVHLFPPESREYAGDVLTLLEKKLWWWVVGVVISMTAVGVFTAIGLMIIGTPLSLTLGIIAGMFEFIPNIGPILSAIPGVLIAITVSPNLVLYTLIVYTGVQMLENSLLVPMIHKQTVSLPPVVGFVFQILMGAVFGFLGLFLAIPLAVTILYLFKTVYRKEILKEEIALERV